MAIGLLYGRLSFLCGVGIRRNHNDPAHSTASSLTNHNLNLHSVLIMSTSYLIGSYISCWSDNWNYILVRIPIIVALVALAIRVCLLVVSKVILEIVIISCV